MTKPRINPDRELYGILGKFPDASAVQKEWNAHFAGQGIDAFMDRYPTTVDQLPERLSEMFHFDRRMYLVGHELNEVIVPLLDTVTEAAAKEGKVHLIINAGGVLAGHALAVCSITEVQKLLAVIDL